MVERPIKKSERQAVTANDLDTPETQSSINEGAEGSNTQSPQKPSTPPPLPVKDKKREKVESNKKMSNQANRR